ncbi:glycosyltransferase family 61 protein [Mucilaginibacter frigoritolerans]|uniref:glycosyltransferase family 61 protein n=1 Tax=Mucilaginibacter frigoritolerans TaxID=652788 RepID=UPI0011A6E8F0|nr:glycosyltransferase family 61 protein [Mucilaginibacter frigoritolerans]
MKTLFRKGILDVLRRFKIYRAYSLIPKGEINFSQLEDAKVLKADEYPPIKRKTPFTIGEGIYWKFEQSLNDVPQKTFVIEANGWRVWGNQGAAINSKEYLFKDVSREFEKPGHSIFLQLKLAPLVHLAGTSALINASGADMYYHWMVDILPRLKLLLDCNFNNENIDHYIVDYRGISFQTETLAILGINDDKISRADNHFNYHVLAERLIVPSLASKLDVVSADACGFLRDTFLKEEKISSFGKKIYLKRTGKRKLINQAEIEEYLESLGFQAVQCENYSVEEQVAIFQHADIVIGPHGAAFTNVVFCKPGTKVIEFFSPRWINQCYWTICNEVALEYYYLIGEGPPPADHSDAKGTTADIQLNPDKIKQLFKQFHI